MKQDALLDTSGSKLRLPQDDKLISKVKTKITSFLAETERDASDRTKINKRRHDFYEGNHGSYSNIVDNVSDTKQKKGHTNQTTNYAGKTVVKMAYALANNPPKLTVPGLDEADMMESTKAQAVEDYVYSIFDARYNRFFKKTYRRACIIQAEFGEAAIKTFIDQDDHIRIVIHDNISSLRIAWSGDDPNSYDSIATVSQLTPTRIKELYGIVVNQDVLLKSKEAMKEVGGVTGGWGSSEKNSPFGTPSASSTNNSLPTGKTDIATLKVVDFESTEFYVIMIEDEVVQLVIKDDINYPKVSMWTIVHNIPNPPSPWSIADIDYLIDPQIELNDNDNRTSDYIRVGGVQRYVAYNLNGFDPKSISTYSGQVITVNSPNGDGRFEPLQTNINNFPADQYHARKLSQIYDMGLPKVNYGSSTGDSGRGKAVDYQSSIDITNFKRDAWELALQEIAEKIQIYGYHLHGDTVDWFTDTDGNFVVRDLEFDWSDILPVSAGDKIVNIANKVNMIGIPLKQAFKELGYRNVDKLIEQLKEEMADPALMTIRAKMWQLSSGILMAQNAAAQMQANTMPTQPDQAGGQPSPMMTQEQNSGDAKPMASQGGTTAYSSARGMIDRTRQNLTAQGK